MSGREYFGVVWYCDFLGIGYLRNSRGWYVFPMFTNSKEAEEIWEKEIEPLEEKTLKMRFIEYESGEYKFILYPFPFLHGKSNFCFYRSIGFSDSYNVFKKDFEGKAYFTFGIIRDSSTTYGKSKLVTDIKFMKNSEVAKNSPEWIAEQVQKTARAGYG